MTAYIFDEDVMANNVGNRWCTELGEAYNDRLGVASGNIAVFYGGKLWKIAKRCTQGEVTHATENKFQQQMEELQEYLPGRRVEHA